MFCRFFIGLAAHFAIQRMVFICNSVNDVRAAFLHPFNQNWNVLGRLLQVIIHCYDPFSVGLVKTANGGVVLPKIFSEAEKFYFVWMFLFQIEQNVPTVILRKIVNENNLNLWRNSFKSGNYSLRQFGQRPFAVENRDDYRIFHIYEPAVKPPSKTISEPVIHFDAGESKKAMVFATSSGSPNPNGYCSPCLSINSLLTVFSASSKSGVFTIAARITLLRIFCGAFSIANVLL